MKVAISLMKVAIGLMKMAISLMVRSDELRRNSGCRAEWRGCDSAA